MEPTGLGFRVLGFVVVWGLGFGVWGFRVLATFRVLGFWVLGF